LSQTQPSGEAGLVRLYRELLQCATVTFRELTAIGGRATLKVCVRATSAGRDGRREWA